MRGYKQSHYISQDGIRAERGEERERPLSRDSLIFYESFDKCIECNSKVKYDKQHAETWCIKCGLIQEVDYYYRLSKIVDIILPKYNGMSNELLNKKTWTHEY